jgi:hypothetical protein
MANAAFSELLYAVELVERGATQSFLAAGSLVRITYARILPRALLGCW